jgi:5-(carboxyamino)imidazole ribonucleotide synthase
MTTVGVLGAGQLGRMLALAGLPLGLNFRFFDPTPDSPAAQLAEQVVGDYADTDALARFAAGLNVVTYEFENVPVACALALAAHLPIYPPPLALDVAQDRVAEKRFLQQQGIPTPPFAPVSTPEDLDEALAQIGLPAMLKTRCGGYDGKGQEVLTQNLPALPFTGEAGCIVEGFVSFQRELSLLAARGQDGECRFYPLIENHHREGILRLSLAPAPDLTPSLQTLAEEYARRLLNALGYVGVLAIEFFEKDGGLIANEIAPRVHNSGHWTIEGAETSQFENHLRAVVGLPLGATEPRGHSAMINLIGTLPDPATVLAVPGAHLHLYGKTPRPGRKLGHITVRADDPETLRDRLEKIHQRMP